MIEIPKYIYENVELFESNIQEIRRDTDEYKKGLNECINKQREIEERVESLYNSQIFFENPINDLEEMVKYSEHSYENLAKFIGHKVKMTGFLELFPVVVCNKKDESEYAEKIPLRDIVKGINSLIKNTAIFTPQEIIFARSLQRRVNLLWDSAEEKIREKNLFMRLFHEMIKIFGWRVSVKLPEEIQNINPKRDRILYLL